MQYRARVVKLRNTIQNSRSGLKETVQKECPGQQENFKQNSRKVSQDQHNGSFGGCCNKRTPYGYYGRVCTWAERSEQADWTDTKAQEEKRKYKVYQVLRSKENKCRVWRCSTGEDQSKVMNSRMEVSQVAQSKKKEK